MSKQRKNGKFNKGFTLAEVLLVVAITSVLAAVGFISASRIMKNMNQKALDKTAQTIYTAAQNRFAEIVTAGDFTKFRAASANCLDGIEIVEDEPSDYTYFSDESYPVSSAKKLCYITSKSGAAVDYLFPGETISSEWLSNNWVIEYDPVTMTVYSVFYSEEESTNKFYDDRTVADSLRYKSAADDNAEGRKDYGATVGYFAGGVIDTEYADTDIFYTQVKVDEYNREKLVANITVGNIPEAVDDDDDTSVVLHISIEGESSGNTIYLKDVTLGADGNTLRTYSFVLDSLEDGESFYEQFCDADNVAFKIGSGEFVGTADKPSRALIAGEDIMVTVEAESKSTHALNSAVRWDETNSLFADVIYIDDMMGVSVCYGRHLQNLDSRVSGFDPEALGVTLVNVTQIPTKLGVGVIDFSENADNAMSTGELTRLESWYATYGERQFLAIDNEYIESFDGDNNKIIGADVVANPDNEDNDNAGLFASFYGKDLRNIILVDECVTGNGKAAVGGIAGELVKGSILEDGMVEIAGCQSYLVNLTGDEDYRAADDDWLCDGKYLGGLVGFADRDANFIESMASTVLKNTISDGDDIANYAGGLAGFAGDYDITFENSYADCYICADSVGGLAGRSGQDTVITSCYTAGFAIECGGSDGVEGKCYKLAAGFVPSVIDILENSYTVFELNDPTPDIVKSEADRVSYGAVKGAGEITNSYYTYEVAGEKSITGLTLLTKNEMKALREEGEDAQVLGSSFLYGTDGTRTNAYNLTEAMALSAYPYPTLTFFGRHYGDWSEAEIEGGSLVYYEVYLDENNANPVYRYEGAGKTTLYSQTMLDNSGYHLSYDGYGILYPAKDTERSYAQDVDIYIGDDVENQVVTLTLDKSDNIALTIEGDKYYLRKIPFEYLDTEAVSGEFYTEIAIDYSHGNIDNYYFNPCFAATAIEVNDFSAKTVSLSGRSIKVRSARHLNLLSRNYPAYRSVASGITFKQEINIDYNTYDFDMVNLSVDTYGGHFVQNPIGTIKDGVSYGFKSGYDGGCNVITGVGIIAEAQSRYAGLFGLVESGSTLKNIVYALEYDSDDYYTIKYDGPISGSGQNVYFGMLAGLNRGNITNCAVCGARFAGELDDKICTYEYSRTYMGGLVGYNTGIISNSSADMPCVSVESNNSNVSLAGFAGYNSGVIRRCYALGNLKLTKDGSGQVYIGGFAAANSGSVVSSYCEIIKETSGVSTSNEYSFAVQGGTVSDCFYLADGAYNFVDNLYLLDVATDDDAAEGIRGTELKAKATDGSFIGFGAAAGSYYYDNTKTYLGNSDDLYPYPAVVTDSKGNLVHYGDWMVTKDYGDAGFYYWECEENGTNNGYHFYLISEDGELSDTLCDAHDDGGVITSYGYGYFSKKEYTPAVTVSKTDGVSDINWGEENEEANTELYESIGDGYDFHSFTTMSAFKTAAKQTDKLYLASSAKNVLATLKVNGNTYRYTFSPFFGGALESGDTRTALGAADGREYMIRSVSQLQFINWNSYTASCMTTLNASYFGNITTNRANNYKHGNVPMSYTYLGYAHAENSGTGTEKDYDGQYYFDQNHDVDGQMSADDSLLFTPIGSIYDSNYANSVNDTYAYTVYFNGSYNGNSYKIKDIQINSTGQAVGLFGVMLGGRLDSVILYSDAGNEIKTDANGVGWYNIGGLVGMSAVGGSSIAKMSNYGFTNCVVAGYTLVDERSHDGYGGANVGGITGLSNLNISGCQAVVDIELAASYQTSAIRNVRVGGIVGTYRGKTLENCYSGGSVSQLVYKSALSNVGGIMGGYFMRTVGNISTILGTLHGSSSDKINIKNCYTYMDMSGLNTSSGKINALCPVVSDGNNESNVATSSITVSNCYYYEPSSVTYVHRTADSKSGACYKVTFEQLSGESKLTAGTYSGKDIYTALNAGSGTYWQGVTTTELAYTVNGKYSFPGADTELKGKDYPFPTVVTQKDSFGDTVYVHYGTWPKENGLYISSSDVSLDLFAYTEADGEKVYEYEKTVKLSYYSKANVLDSIDVDNLSYTAGDDQITSVTFESNSDGTVNMTISGVLTGYELGTVTYMLSDGSDVKVNVSVTVTAQLLAKAIPQDGYMAYDSESGTYDLIPGRKIAFELVAYDKYEHMITGLTLKNWSCYSSDKDVIYTSVSDVKDDEGTKHTILTLTMQSAGKGEVYYQAINVPTNGGFAYVESSYMSEEFTIKEVPDNYFISYYNEKGKIYTDDGATVMIPVGSEVGYDNIYTPVSDEKTFAGWGINRVSGVTYTADELATLIPTEDLKLYAYWN